MPSHVAHLLFAEQLLETLPADVCLTLDAESYPFFTLGAQGPDIFYHNRRRKPSGLEYGARLHRKGYAEVCAAMLQSLINGSLSSRSTRLQLSAYLFAFTTHAFLDRIMHPYINYRAGWFDPQKPSSATVKGAHAYLERLIDTELLMAWRGCTFDEFDFFHRVDLGEHPPSAWIELLASALHAEVPRARTDSHLRTRIEHAYLDARGFYQFTNRSLEAQFSTGGHRRENEPPSLRFAALLHPNRVPDGIDPLNTARTPWRHPCAPEREYTSDVYELIEQARQAATPAALFLAEQLRLCDLRYAADTRGDIDQITQELTGLIGYQNLSDGESGVKPCRKQFCDPLPLMETLAGYIQELSS